MPHPTLIVPLEAGLFVEVDVDREDIKNLSASDFTDKLGDGLALIRGAIRKLSVEAAESVMELRDKFEVTDLEIEAGIGIQAEGHVYIAKGTGNANLKVTFKIRPRVNVNQP